MMNRNQQGDLIVKWWGIIVALVAFIAAAGVAHYRIGATEARQDEHERSVHEGARGMVRGVEVNLDSVKERLTRNEERMVQVQKDIDMMRQENRGAFERLERAVGRTR